MGRPAEHRLPDHPGQVGLANGGLFGIGLGEGRAKWGFLPDAHTDFIFAIIGEELGLVGALIVVALFVALGVLGVRTAPAGAATGSGCCSPRASRRGSSCRPSSTSARCIGGLPITGVPLPFVSFGGSSLLVTMAAAGLLLNVARHPATADARGRSAGDARTFALVAGGGTAGHVLPGLAVARALVARGHDPATIHFVGSDRGLETDARARGRLRAHRLPGRGIQRRLTLAPTSLPSSGLVRAGVPGDRPRAPPPADGRGGARRLRQRGLRGRRRAVAGADRGGRAERPGGRGQPLAGRFAKAAAVPFEDTDLPREVVTGNPVRAEILGHRPSARPRRRHARRSGLPVDRTVVAVFSGSLGSRTHQRGGAGAAAGWADRDRPRRSAT